MPSEEKKGFLKKLKETFKPGVMGGVGLAKGNPLSPAKEIEKKKDREAEHKHRVKIEKEIKEMDKSLKKDLEKPREIVINIFQQIQNNQTNIISTTDNASIDQETFERKDSRFRTEDRFRTGVNFKDRNISLLDFFDDPEWGMSKDMIYVRKLTQIFLLGFIRDYYDVLDFIMTIERKGEIVYRDLIGDIFPDEKVIRESDVPYKEIRDKTVLFFDDSIGSGSTIYNLVKQVKKEEVKTLYVMSMVSKKSSLEKLRMTFPDVTFITGLILPDDLYDGFYREMMFPYFDSLNLPKDTSQLIIKLSLNKKLNKEKIFEVLKKNIEADVYEPSKTIDDPETYKITVEYPESKWENWGIRDMVDSIECTKVRFYVNNKSNTLYIYPVVNPIFSEFTDCESLKCDLGLEYCIKDELGKRKIEFNDEVKIEIDRDCVIYNLISYPLNEVFGIFSEEILKDGFEMKIEELSHNGWSRKYGNFVLEPIKKHLEDKLEK